MSIVHGSEGSTVFSPRRQAEPTPARNTLGHGIAHQIEESILARHLRPGDQLPSERELSRHYAMSRTVIRDALAMLAERGLLRIVPGKGIFVNHSSPSVMRDSLRLLLRREQASADELMQARQLLEEQTALLAAQKARAADIATLKEAVALMRASKGDIHRFVQADVAFHEALARAAGNRVILSFLLSLHDLLQESMIVGAATPGAFDHNLADHEALLAAVIAGDGAAARDAMRQHLEHTYREWVGVGVVQREQEAGSEPALVDLHAVERPRLGTQR